MFRLFSLRLILLILVCCNVAYMRPRPGRGHRGRRPLSRRLTHDDLRWPSNPTAAIPKIGWASKSQGFSRRCEYPGQYPRDPIWPGYWPSGRPGGRPPGYWPGGGPNRRPGYPQHYWPDERPNRRPGYPPGRCPKWPMYQNCPCYQWPEDETDDYYPHDIENLNAWSAKLFIQSYGEDKVCHGSVISNQLIITAAECLEDAEMVYIVMGNNGRIKLQSNQFTISSSTPPLGIGLIKLPQPVITDDVEIIPLGPLHFDTGLAATAFTESGDRIMAYGMDENDCASYGFETGSEGCVIPINDENPCDVPMGSGLVVFEEGEPMLIGVAHNYDDDSVCNYGFPIPYSRIAAYDQWLMYMKVN